MINFFLKMNNKPEFACRKKLIRMYEEWLEFTYFVPFFEQNKQKINYRFMNTL